MNEVVLLPQTRKPKLFSWGSCDLYDVLENPLIRANYELDYHLSSDIGFDYRLAGREPTVTTSLASFYAEPGVIAERVHDCLTKPNQTITHAHRIAYREVTKFPYIKYMKENAGPRDIFVISFSTELYSKVYQGKECITMMPKFKQFCDPSDPLHWMVKELFHKPDLVAAFDTEEEMVRTREHIKDFVRDIKEIFGDRIVMLKTHLTNSGIDKNGKLHLLPFDATKLSIPYYKTSRLVETNHDHSYSNRWCDLVLSMFQRYSRMGTIPAARVNDRLFMDLDHPWGVTPFHLEKHSVTKLSQALLAELQQVSLRVDQQLSLQASKNESI